MNDRRVSKERFAKIQALGNDFIWLLDPVDSIEADPRRPWIPFLSSDRVGIGADGVILWRPVSEISAELWFFNRDGSAAEVCGNGLRAVAEAGCALGYFHRRDLSLIMWGRSYSVEFHEAECAWSVGLKGDNPVTDIDNRHAIQMFLDKQGLHGILVYMPNPHVVIIEDSPISRETREEIAAELNRRIDRGVNVGFYTPHSHEAGSLSVWERGVGWTPACGSGAAATLLTCIAFDRAGNRLHVTQPGGPLVVERRSDGFFWITGKANLVFTGSIVLRINDGSPPDIARWNRRVSTACVFDI